MGAPQFGEGKSIKPKGFFYSYSQKRTWVKLAELQEHRKQIIQDKNLAREYMQEINDKLVVLTNKREKVEQEISKFTRLKGMGSTLNEAKNLHTEIAHLNEKHKKLGSRIEKHYLLLSKVMNSLNTCNRDLARIDRTFNRVQRNLGITTTEEPLARNS